MQVIVIQLDLCPSGCFVHSKSKKGLPNLFQAIFFDVTFTILIGHTILYSKLVVKALIIQLMSRVGNPDIDGH
jgi:hypothetical protein